MRLGDARLARPITSSESGLTPLALETTRQRDRNDGCTPDHFACHAERLRRGQTMTLNRREFVQLAAAMGASLAWGGSARASTTAWHERRDLFPHGVASGDPDSSSVILWTRRPYESGGKRALTVEVAEDDAFRRVVANASAPAMKCGPSSSAFHARSRAATVPMAVLFATGSSTRHRSGNRASGLCCASKSLRATPAFRSEMAPSFYSPRASTSAM